MARSRSRGRNNNPSGRNQYSDWGVLDTVREHPAAAAAAAAGAAAAGLFLWSKRAKISDQISNLSEQFSEWTENMRSGDVDDQFDDATELTITKRRGSTGSPSGRRRSAPTS